MNRLLRSRLLAGLSLILLGFLDRQSYALAPNFCAAYFETNVQRSLLLFPSEGGEEDVSLPESLPLDFYPVAFSPDGEKIYGEILTPASGGGIWVIKFAPARLSLVPGSAGFSRIRHLTPLPSGLLLVSGPFPGTERGGCGIVEIDPRTQAVRTIREGKAPECGGGAGPVSPDGKRALTYAAKKLAVVDLGTGALKEIQGLDPGPVSAGLIWISGCTWSPDGRWIACVRGGRILLIDGDNLNKRRSLGSAGSGRLSWSPDSRSILVARSQVTCGLGYGGTLEVIDVSSGRRVEIASSRCKIGSGQFGWIDRNSLMR